METKVRITISTLNGEVLEDAKVWLMEKEQDFTDGPSHVARRIMDRLGHHFEVEE